MCEYGSLPYSFMAGCMAAHCNVCNDIQLITSRVANQKQQYKNSTIVAYYRQNDQNWRVNDPTLEFILTVNDLRKAKAINVSTL